MDELANTSFAVKNTSISINVIQFANTTGVVSILGLIRLLNGTAY